MSERRVTALVPMKHHSERVPGKNYRPFCGRPLLHWIIDALESSRSVEEIVVNTDSSRVAEELAGRAVTVLDRPEHLLGDDVVADTLIRWDLDQVAGDFFLQTHATNPLVKPGTIDRAVNAFFDSEGHDSLLPVTSLHTRLYWPDGRPVNHDPANLIPTQELPEILEENSCLYVFSRETFEREGRRLGADPLLFRMDPLEAVDIDEEQDFAIAEAIMSSRLATEAGRS